jgi:hypothetical protein
MNQENVPAKQGAYGKRPIWQWVLIYAVVGGAVYAGVYYLTDHKSASGSSIYGSQTKATTQAAPAPAGTTAPTPASMPAASLGQMW